MLLNSILAEGRMLKCALRSRLLTGVALVLAASVFANEAAEDILKEAQSAFEQGDKRKALVLVEKALKVEQDNPQALFFSGQLHDSFGQFDRAIADFTALLRLQPKAANIYQLRGSALFKLGKIDESIADFDKEIGLAPDREPYHWQRGISYYYAEKFEHGRRQFESHRAVNANDVENAVWHYLCVARSTDVNEAHDSLIPIARDSRIPMMKIHAMFAGKVKPDAVFDAAEEGHPSDGELTQRRFYAHLYVGLYYEVQGYADLAEEHILAAVESYPVKHYMGDVARVHATLRGYPSKTDK